jgi:DNA-binding response OmpR family regulator
MKPTLLIAEGDAELCDIYRRFFSNRGYQVETASDGLDCLQQLRRLTPAAVVLDLELRWGGGDGVLAWLREQGAAARVPVVLTATASQALEVEGYVAPPVVEVLAKPFALTVLLESVRAALVSKAAAPACNRNRSEACSEYFLG